MAILSNINDLFAVDSTGAILFNSGNGSAGEILKSNGASASPTWVDGSTVIGGPYLPLSGGTLTGATATASGISFTVGGALTGTTAGFSGSITASGNSNSFGNTTIAALSASTGTFSASVTAAGNSNSFGTTTFGGNVSITKAGTPELILTDTTNNVNLLIAADNANTFLRSSSGAPILFQTNGGTTALTLSGANATVAGTIFASNNSPAYSFASDTNTGIARTGTHQMAFLQNNATSLTLDALACATFEKSVLFNNGAAFRAAASIRQQSDILILTGGGNGFDFNDDANSVTHLKINSGGEATFSSAVNIAGTLTLDQGSLLNGIINTPASLRINIDSNNSSVGEVFIVGHNQTNIDNNNVLFKVEENGTSTFYGNILVSSTSNGIFLGGTGSSSVLKKFVGNQAGNGAQWTPTVTTSQATSPTITSSSGYYQQVGNVVTVSFEFTMGSNHASGAGTVIISNLPIAIADTNHVSGCGSINDLGKTINVRHYTASNQIGMNFYDGNYCGTQYRTVGTVTYWAAT